MALKVFAGTALLAVLRLDLLLFDDWRFQRLSHLVNRTALPLVVKPVAVIMAISAALLFVVIMLPAVLGIGGNILDTKRKKNRLKRPFCSGISIFISRSGGLDILLMEMTRRLAQATGLAATTQNTDFCFTALRRCLL